MASNEVFIMTPDIEQILRIRAKRDAASRRADYEEQETQHWLEQFDLSTGEQERLMRVYQGIVSGKAV